MDLELVRTFVEVADQGGFTPAAEALGLPRSSVSRRVARLERELGVQLLHRTTRRVGLTSAGEQLYQRVAAHLAAVDRALDDLPEREDEPSGRLRVTMPHDLATVGCASAIAGFVRRYPRVDLEVHASSRRVDLVAESVDVALRTGPPQLPDSSMRSRRLGLAAGALYASPGYLQRAGRPRGLAEPEALAWVAGPGTGVPPQAEVVLTCDDMLVVRAALREGLGVAFLPDFLARADVLDGRLVRGADGATFAVHAVYPPVRPMPRKLRVFVDYLVDYFRGHPLS